MQELDRLTFGTVFYLLSWVVSFVFAYQILRERRSPTATVAWIAFVFLLPLLGIAIYLLIGARKLKRPRRQRVRPHFSRERELPFGEASALDQLLRRLGAAGATGDNLLVFHLDARAARLALLELIQSAEREIFVLMYTFAVDVSGRGILKALTDAVERGVKVRLMVDDIGSTDLRSPSMDAYRRAGGRLVRFKPVWYAIIQRVANLRNHRKIVVADGARAWFGGRNVGDEYLADHAEQSRWADLSVHVEGSAALALEAICQADWAFANDIEVPTNACGAEIPRAGSQQVQILASGPDQREDVWHTAFIKVCFEARERLWIVTPYLVPDDASFGALATAARSGVDVRVIVPERSDSRLMDVVGASYLRELKGLNVKVFRYRPGMLHAKFVLVDDGISLVGSANLDARSFFLNYEVVGVFYDQTANQTLAEYFQKLEARSAVGMKPVRATTELLASTLRILAPML